LQKYCASFSIHLSKTPQDVYMYFLVRFSEVSLYIFFPIGTFQHFVSCGL